MRRVKRNKDKRAYKHGYNQGLKGHAKEGCPFSELDKKGQWLGGWRLGHAEYVAGYRFASVG
jgi:ribosome modulation factor